MIARRDLLRALISWPIGAWFPSRGRALAGVVVPRDAASHYRRAFEELARLTRSDAARIAGWKTTPLDGAARGLLRRASPALSALHRGAAIPGCEWGDVVRLESLNRGHLDVLNFRVAKIALLRARILVESGRGQGALDDIFAAASFGRHLGRAGVLIARIFQVSLENEAIVALAASLLKLDRATRDAIPGRIAALPRPCSWAQTMRLEARFIESALMAKFEAVGSPIGPEVLAEADLSPEEVEAVLVRTGGDLGRLRALVAEVEPFLGGLAEVQGLPLADHESALAAFRSRAIHPFARSVVDHAEGLKYAIDRTALLWSMVGAALARIDEGPVRFRSIADPYGEGPFSDRPRGEGFELRSAFPSKEGAPALLIVGGGAAPPA